jgi:hypothetical protein
MSAVFESFNASVFVSEQLNRQLINMSQDLAHRCVEACAERYNFDAEEACRLLGLAMIKLERKAPMKAKSEKAAKVVVPKSAFPLPYNGEFDNACCFALRQNNGLYTQCTGVRKGDAQFCKSCATTMQKTAAEVPEYGTIQQRLAANIFEYVDPKGRKPVAYTKVMKKYKITEDQVMEEAGKFNIKINAQHFVVPETDGVKRGRPKADKEPKVKGAKGRPKKEKKVIMLEDDDDLFASLVAEANEDADAVLASEDADEELAIPSKKTDKKDSDKKESERLARETKKAEAEAAKKLKEEQRLKEKAEAEAAKKQKEEQRLKEKAEKEAKIAAEKKLKEEQRLKEKAEKEAKLAAEKAAKEAAKAKSSKKPAQPEEDEEPDIVKKIEFAGKKYLKSKKTGIIYDYDEYLKNGEQVVVGKWNDVTNKIDFADAEEEEEEYDV